MHEVSLILSLNHVSGEGDGVANFLEDIVREDAGHDDSQKELNDPVALYGVELEFAAKLRGEKKAKKGTGLCYFFIFIILSFHLVEKVCF